MTKKSEAYLEIEGIHCCVDCEAGIPDNRLKANPGAVRCIKCQRAEEFKPLK
ncbi:MAG: TraR/DksA C4-type zinc finger protein [Thermodesulfovibrionia bacterium]|nr:TraR/DksA C4-type zinc finger protein [Thermodesulfovibrionia bacterium]